MPEKKRYDIHGGKPPGNQTLTIGMGYNGRTRLLLAMAGVLLGSGAWLLSAGAVAHGILCISVGCLVGGRLGYALWSRSPHLLFTPQGLQLPCVGPGLLPWESIHRAEAIVINRRHPMLLHGTTLIGLTFHPGKPISLRLSRSHRLFQWLLWPMRSRYDLLFDVDGLDWSAHQMAAEINRRVEAIASRKSPQS